MMKRWCLAVAALCLAGCQSVVPEPAPAAQETSVVPAPATVAPVTPTLALTPIPAPQGGQVQVSGRGFTDGEYVTFSASRAATGADVVTLGGATASAQGSVDAVALTLPEELLSGPHVIE